MPAPPETYLRAMTKLIEFATAFGIPAGDPEAVQRIYREKLADLPGDLLLRAIVRVTDQWAWGNRLPMPGEIRKTVSSEFSQRHMLLSKARVAMLKVRAEEPHRNKTYDKIPPERWTHLRALIAGASKKDKGRD